MQLNETPDSNATVLKIQTAAMSSTEFVHLHTNIFMAIVVQLHAKKRMCIPKHA